MTRSRQSKQINQHEYYMKLMKVAACQVNILNIYDPDGRDDRELKYDDSSSADIDGDYTRHMITTIQEFDQNINLWQKDLSPDLEKAESHEGEELRNQLSSLDKLKQDISTI